MTTHAWGVSHRLHLDGQTQLERALGTSGGSSSWHLHRHKSNTFLVISGKVRITIGENVLVLGRNDSITVPAGTRHRMEFLSDGELLELYNAVPGQPLDPLDIVRFDEGHP